MLVEELSQLVYGDVIGQHLPFLEDWIVAHIDPFDCLAAEPGKQRRVLIFTTEIVLFEKGVVGLHEG